MFSKLFKKEKYCLGKDFEFMIVMLRVYIHVSDFFFTLLKNLTPGKKYRKLSPPKNFSQNSIGLTFLFLEIFVLQKNFLKYESLYSIFRFRKTCILWYFNSCRLFFIGILNVIISTKLRMLMYHSLNSDCFVFQFQKKKAPTWISIPHPTHQKILLSAGDYIAYTEGELYFIQMHVRKQSKEQFINPQMNFYFSVYIYGPNHKSFYDKLPFVSPIF